MSGKNEGQQSQQVKAVEVVEAAGSLIPMARLSRGITLRYPALVGSSANQRLMLIFSHDEVGPGEVVQWTHYKPAEAFIAPDRLTQFKPRMTVEAWGVILGSPQTVGRTRYTIVD
ncbi:MAG: hypothetical protein ACTHOL_13630 [Luteibacter jiangsuensis]